MFEEDQDDEIEKAENEQFESEKQLPVLKTKGKAKRKPAKRQIKEKLGSWESAMKKNVSCFSFLHFFLIFLIIFFYFFI